MTTAARRALGDDGKEIRCEIFWDVEGKVQTLGHVLLPVGEDGWHELRVEIPQEAGNLLLSARLAGPGLAEQEAEAICWASPVVRQSIAPSQPDVILITIDTLRFDALEDMPYLQGLMTTGKRWEQAYVPSNWTLPSMASLMTGLPPESHGCGRGPFAEVATGKGEDRAFRSLAAVPTLAEAMSDSGFATAMFHQNPFLENWTGLQRGFQSYVRTADRPEANHGPAWDWWNHSKGAPRFLSLHYMAPHLPNGVDSPITESGAEAFFIQDHTPEERIAFFDLPEREREAVRQAYREAVVELDQELERLLVRLREDAPDCHILIFADHGEEHWDTGGFEHGFQFTDSVLHVPLAWIAGEDAQAEIVADVVPAHHLGTYLLEQLGIPNDLPASALGDSPSADRRVESTLPLYRAPTGGRRWDAGQGWIDLPFLGQGSPGIAAAIDPWTAKRLAELGYAED
jgi:arylsulfatase A-like enzyme